jgi:hypothetical protein
MFDEIIAELTTKRDLTRNAIADLLAEARALVPFEVYSMLMLFSQTEYQHLDENSEAQYLVFVQTTLPENSMPNKLQRFASVTLGKNLLTLMSQLSETEARLLEKRKLAAFHE